MVKLLALLTVGPFVLFVLFDGPGDLLAHVESAPAVAERISREGSPLTWVVTTLLSAMAFLCLPRQFHVAVVEHGHPASLKTARWLFPAYLLLINLFVVPIAAAGLLTWYKRAEGRSPGSRPKKTPDADLAGGEA